MNSFLEKIPGQLRVKKTLNTFLQTQKIPQALLFVGIEGVGKFNAAIQFAKSLTNTIDSQNQSKAIREIELLHEPYLKLIFALPRGKNEDDSSSPTEKLTQDEIDTIREQLELKSNNSFYKIAIPKANTIKINSIRDIKRFLAMNYDDSSYRFIIISDAHFMNEEAQNSLLKSLEEPPRNVLFILTTSSLSKLRQTISSRCWKINFDPLLDNEVSNILVENFKIEKELAEDVAPFSYGSVISALNLIEADFNQLKERTISLLRYSFGRKFQSAFDQLAVLLNESNFESFNTVIRMIITWLNDIQRHRFGFKGIHFTNYMDTLDKFNRKFPDAQLIEMTSKLEKLSSLKQNNINPVILSSNLIFELASVVLNNR